MAGETSGLGNRQHERQKINEEKFLSLNGERVMVNDISYGGVSLFSPRPASDMATLKPDNGAEAMEVRILECIQPPGDLALPDFPYKLRCQFTVPPADDNIEKLVNYVVG